MGWPGASPGREELPVPSDCCAGGIQWQNTQLVGSFGVERIGWWRILTRVDKLVSLVGTGKKFESFWGCGPIDFLVVLVSAQLVHRRTRRLGCLDGGRPVNDGFPLAPT
jgi:hypothetical protein